ncbi:TPA: acyltransferase, partial [Vibrio vulnificus]|nr:acyltransferase [Vibrio vulnificus]
KGDYFNDKPYKRQFQLWLGDVWQEKDQLLKEIHKG